jgi:hypothetical protein
MLTGNVAVSHKSFRLPYDAVSATASRRNIHVQPELIARGRRLRAGCRSATPRLAGRPKAGLALRIGPIWTRRSDWDGGKRGCTRIIVMHPWEIQEPTGQGRE